jgi:hypothetical protein
MRVDTRGLRRATLVFALLIAFVLAILAYGAYLRGANGVVLAVSAAGGLLLGWMATLAFMRWRESHPVTQEEVRNSRWTARVPRGGFVAFGLVLGAVVAVASRGHGTAGTAVAIAVVATGTGALLAAGANLQNADYSWMDKYDPERLEEIARDSDDPAVGAAWAGAAPYQRVMLVVVGLTFIAMIAAAVWVALR